MERVDLHVVEDLKPYDEVRGLRDMAKLRAKLLTVAAQYVLEGKADNPKERIRRASEMSGIPTKLLEAQFHKSVPHRVFTVDPNRFVPRSLQADQAPKVQPPEEPKTIIQCSIRALSKLF